MQMGFGGRGAEGAAAAAAAPGNFSDTFADLSAWTVEQGGGSVTASGNELVFATSSEYGRVHRQVSDAAPATWATITVSCEVWLTSDAYNNDFGIGVCMDDPPTGQPNAGSFPPNMMQNGYGCLFRPAGFSEKVSRFATGIRTNLSDTNETSLSGGAWKAVTTTFTKLADRVRIDRTYDGSGLTQVDDTDASRQTGACTVVLYGNALSSNVVKFRNLVVTVT